MTGLSLDDYVSRDALGLAELVRRGEVSAAELLDAARQAIDAVEPRLDFLVGDTYAQAQRAIAAGLPDGPFTGVPFLKKDLGQACAGIVCDSGCALAQGLVADHDSTLFERIKRAGLVIVGRSAVPSLGGSGTTEPAYRGRPTRNPWDRTRSTGGSSGGAAAAVAARVVPIAHATDGGGSIRIPAALCGLVGHKPTRGLLPCGPDFGEILGGFAVDGVVTRTVRDTAAFLDAVAGPDAGCRYFTPPPARAFLSALEETPARLRIAVNVTSPAGVAVDPACARAAHEAARLFADAGHVVELVRPFPDDVDSGLAGGYLWAWHTAAAARAFSAATGRPVTPETVEPAMAAMAAAGETLSALDVSWALGRINEFTRAFGRFFEAWDLLVEPATAIPAPPLGSIPDHTPGVTVEEWGAAIVPLNCFTNRANKAGLPAVTVPWDVTDSGLPVGVQLMAPFAADARCLQMARFIEMQRPWLTRRPLVCASMR